MSFENFLFVLMEASLLCRVGIMGNIGMKLF